MGALEYRFAVLFFLFLSAPLAEDEEPEQKEQEGGHKKRDDYEPDP